jgi:hypothetical protein
MKRIVILLVLFWAGNTIAYGKTERFGTWIELEFRKDFLERFSFSLSPEIRLQDQFKPDEFLLQGKLSYEPISLIKFAAAYRVNTERKKRGNVTFYRYAFDAHIKKDIGRFEAALRGRYTNFSETYEVTSEKFIRPRAKLEYDIKGNKIRPFISCELFRNTTKKETHKIRYEVGFTRKLKGPHRIGLYFRLHDYFTDKASIHILGIKYRMKF